MTGAALFERVHGGGCECHRCRGLQPGNELSLKHGAYASPLRLSRDPRHAEIADGIREQVPVYSPADEPVVQLLATCLVRIEKAAAALNTLDETTNGRELNLYISDSAPKFSRLREDLRSWINTARNLANDLGMTPTSRARLGLDLVRGEATRLTVTRLARMAEDESRG